MKKDLVAEKISKCLLGVQQRFSMFMQRKASGYSSRSMKIFCVTWFLILSGMSTWIIIEAFTTRHPAIRLSHIKVAPLLQERERPRDILPVLSFYNLKRFHQYLDSLRKNNTGLYDSLISLRPGIVDSITAIEKIYSSQ